MNDFLGMELSDGDIVVALRYNRTSAELFKGEVIGFTECFVRVMPKDRRHSILISPEKVVVIQEGF